nr:MAG TPA: hypothetical protein [Crassvirales sp.]
MLSNTIHLFKGENSIEVKKMRSTSILRVRKTLRRHP